MGYQNVIYRFLKDKCGATAIIFALTLPVSVGFLALGSETALWFYKQRELQKIVDIAAYNGAVELSDWSEADTGGSTIVGRSLPSVPP